MNRLEYLAHHGEPEEIVNEVMQEIAAWKRLTDTFESNNVALTERIDELEIALRDIAKGCYDAEGCTAIAKQVLEK